jgi:hypothetical protein
MERQSRQEQERKHGIRSRAHSGQELHEGNIVIEEPKHANSRTAKRATEGSRKNSGVARSDRIVTNRGRGRPPGVKNKPKSLVPTELANELLLKMESMVPPEHFKYLKGVIKDGKAVSTKQELDTLILLLNRNLWPALVAEGRLTKSSKVEDIVDVDPDKEDKEDDEKGPVFRKDVTERLKVLNSLLTLRHQIEKNEVSPDDGSQPLLTIFAKRGVSSRLGILIGEVEPPKALPAVTEERVAHDGQIVIDPE